VMLSWKGHFVNLSESILTQTASRNAECRRYDAEERFLNVCAEDLCVLRGNAGVRRFALMAGTMYFAHKFGSGCKLPMVESRTRNRSSDSTFMSVIPFLPGTEFEYGIDRGNWYPLSPHPRTRARSKTTNVYREINDPVKVESFEPGSLFFHARRGDVPIN
jgi:hypothetical protein